MSFNATYPTRSRRETWFPIILAILGAFATASIGGLLTKLGPWYFSLAQPSWKPPDWLFGPAWTLIFALCATAAVFAWWDARRVHKQTRVVLLFLINAACNVLWSGLFFYLQRPDWALIEVAFLWASIVALMGGLWSFSRRAALLLIPYLAWVTFAANLNWAIVSLNGPFRGLS